MAEWLPERIGRQRNIVLVAQVQKAFDHIQSIAVSFTGIQPMMVDRRCREYGPQSTSVARVHRQSMTLDLPASNQVQRR